MKKLKVFLILGCLFSTTMVLGQVELPMYSTWEHSQPTGGIVPSYKLWVSPALTKVGIGTHTPTANLDVAGTIKAIYIDVAGTIRTEEIKVCLNQGCDFVFEKDYNLMPISDLSKFVTENKHLPDITPAAEMESDGINLSEMNAKLLQKVEELTLYVIDLQKQIDELKK